MKSTGCARLSHVARKHSAVIERLPEQSRRVASLHAHLLGLPTAFPP